MNIKAYGRVEEITVNMLPLSEVIESIGEDDLMKMDCENCEFPAILSTSNDVLSRVKELIIEYHDYPKPIVKKLKSAGFIVKVERPWCAPNGKPVGFLYAKKKEVRR
jgi:hypothetical protein